MTPSGENQKKKKRKPVPFSTFSITNLTQSGLRLRLARKLTALNEQIGRSMWSSFKNIMPNSTQTWEDPEIDKYIH